MRVLLGAVGTCLLLVAAALLVVTVMSMGGGEIFLPVLIVSIALGVTGVLLLRRAARPSKRA